MGSGDEASRAWVEERSEDAVPPLDARDEWDAMVRLVRGVVEARGGDVVEVEMAFATPREVRRAAVVMRGAHAAPSAGGGCW